MSQGSSWMTRILVVLSLVIRATAAAELSPTRSGQGRAESAVLLPSTTGTTGSGVTLETEKISAPHVGYAVPGVYFEHRGGRPVQLLDNSGHEEESASPGGVGQDKVNTVIVVQQTPLQHSHQHHDTSNSTTSDANDDNSAHVTSVARDGPVLSRRRRRSSQFAARGGAEGGRAMDLSGTISRRRRSGSWGRVFPSVGSRRPTDSPRRVMNGSEEPPGNAVAVSGGGGRREGMRVIGQEGGDGEEDEEGGRRAMERDLWRLVARLRGTTLRDKDELRANEKRYGGGQPPPGFHAIRG